MALHPLLRRALLFLAITLASCEPPQRTEEELCGPTGCDACIGVRCTTADAGR